jgi:4-amino-4-deoxy-L-arabinose transferase-like glycosyltransferase
MLKHKTGYKKEDILGFLKNNWHFIVLILILAFGVYIRIYHLDYPLIGYHNMKEAHTLMEARHFYNEGNYFTNKFDYLVTIDNPDGIHSDNFPMLGWIIAFMWKFTGVNLFMPRLFMIILSLVIIYFTYLIIFELFGKKDLALLSAFLANTCPLFAFFGRRVFYDVPALMFALIAVYYFLRWKKEPTKSYFIIFTIAITLATLNKMVYLILLFPIAAIFPYERIFSKEGIKKYFGHYIYSLILPVVFFGWSLLSNNPFSEGFVSKILSGQDNFTFLTLDYWKTVYMYATAENFTPLAFYIMAVGFVISLFYIKKEGNRFLVVWMLSVVPYAFVTGWMFTGHNYYQMPFFPAVTALIAFALLYLLNTLVPKFTRTWIKNAIVYSIIIIFILTIFYPMTKAMTYREYDTQFFGLDVAGEFINKNSQPNERIFGSGHQDAAMYWYAERTGVDVPSNLDDFKKMESELNFRWVFMYNWGLDMIPKKTEVWDYIKANYRLRQVGLLQNPGTDKPNLYYLVLEKGGTFDEKKISDYVGNNKLQTKQYELSMMKIDFAWIDIP